MPSESRDEILGAVTALLAITGYLAFLGYGIRLEPDPGAGVLFDAGSVTIQYHPAVLYVPVLAAYGAAAARAIRNRLYVATGFSIIAFLGYPFVRVLGSDPWSGGSVFAFGAEFAFLVAAFALAAVAEYSVANYETVSRSIGRRTANRSLLVGVAHFALIVLLRNVVWSGGWGSLNPFTVAVYAWSAVGLVAVAAIPFYLWMTDGLRLPAATLVVVDVAIVSAMAAGHSVRPETTPSPLSIYMMVWFVPLVAILLAGMVERRVRRRLDSGPAVA